MLSPTTAIRPNAKAARCGFRSSAICQRLDSGGWGDGDVGTITHLHLPLHLAPQMQRAQLRNNQLVTESRSKSRTTGVHRKVRIIPLTES
jgi:hypothetical protein